LFFRTEASNVKKIITKFLKSGVVAPYEEQRSFIVNYNGLLKKDLYKEIEVLPWMLSKSRENLHYPQLRQEQ
jgi:hypothetical protein